MKEQEPLILEGRYNSTDTCFDNHFHSSYELMYVTGGCIRVWIDNREYVAREDSLLLFSNLEEHSGKLLETPFQRYYVRISTNLADRLVGEPVLTALLKNRPADFCHVFDVSDLREELLQFFKAVFVEIKEQDVFSNELCAALLKQLLIHLYRKRKEFFPTAKNRMNQVVYEIQQYMDVHYSEPVSIEEVAKAFYVDLFYLTHCFKQQTGYSPKQYLMKSRISKAKEMLIHTDMAVGEVAFKCGFSDTNNFIRSFKAENGCTPKQYRKSQSTQV